MPDPTRPVPFAPAFAEWHCADQNATAFLGHRHPKPSCQAALEIRFEESERAAFFKLRVPAALKACPKKTNIFVFILPDRILSLDGRPGADATVPEPVRRGLVQANVCSSSDRIARLHFTLAKPPVLVVPAATSLAPATATSGNILNMLQSLAQVTELTLYFPSKHLPRQRLTSLCTLARDGGLQPIASQLDMASLHGGSGAEMVEGTELHIPAPADSPPSYDELALSPPPVLAEGSRRRATGLSDSPTQSPRFKKARLGPAPDDLEEHVAMLCKKAFDGFRSEMRQEMQDRLVMLEERLEKRIDQVAEQLREETATHVDLDDLRDETSEQTELRIEEQMLLVKDELRDHIEEELKNVEDKLKDNICSASVSLNFD
ncbi:hypothetical protein SLS56_006846 [Neofusicoccum ribis]|uniref:Uncharacterized protein n=1 Tax=Neofusicoccum ribis TaxID=45134 RepID=A0ABR3SPS5_9PEZI